MVAIRESSSSRARLPHWPAREETERIAGKACRDGEIACPEVLDLNHAVICSKRPVEDRMIEQAITRPGQFLERAGIQKDISGAFAHILRRRAHGEGRCDGAAAARATENIEAHAGFVKRLEHTDMGGTECAAAACHEPNCFAVDEAGESVVIGILIDHEMMVKGHRPEIEPPRRSGDRRVGLVQKHESTGRRWMYLEGKTFQSAQFRLEKSLVTPN